REYAKSLKGKTFLKDLLAARVVGGPLSSLAYSDRGVPVTRCHRDRVHVRAAWRASAWDGDQPGPAAPHGAAGDQPRCDGARARDRTDPAADVAQERPELRGRARRHRAADERLETHSGRLRAPDL